VVRNCLHELARYTRRRPISGSDYVVNPGAKVPRTRLPAPTFSSEFPILLPQSEKNDIRVIREFRANTNNSALQRFECSFCGATNNTFSFFEVMPTPLSVIRDEICVILVGSPNIVITGDTLRSSGPLLVRTEMLKRAILWLIDNNPLCKDLDKHQTMHNLGEYPELGCPIAVRECLRTNSADNQGTAYHPYSDADEANNELFENIGDNAGLTATTLVDCLWIQTILNAHSNSGNWKRFGR
jgi:hypothetical protein